MYGTRRTKGVNLPEVYVTHTLYIIGNNLGVHLPIPSQKREGILGVT